MFISTYRLLITFMQSSDVYRPTGLGYSLVDALIERQVSNDSNNVPLDLQGVSAELIDPLEELQAPVGNDVVAVALDLQTRKCFSKFSTHSRHVIVILIKSHSPHNLF